MYFKALKYFITFSQYYFYKIKNVILNPQKKYTTYMFIGEIANKELQISSVIDNEVDEKLIIESILNSKFK